MSEYGADPRRADVPDIEALVRGLDNLHWNLHVQTDILRLGERAVAALVRFLLGPPDQFPEGRVLAAEALGRLKGETAFQGLLNAVDPHRFDGLGPILRLSEEEVENTVALQLARIGDRRAIPMLLDALCIHRLVGAADGHIIARSCLCNHVPSYDDISLVPRLTSFQAFCRMPPCSSTSPATEGTFAPHDRFILAMGLRRHPDQR